MRLLEAMVQDSRVVARRERMEAGGGVVWRPARPLPARLGFGGVWFGEFRASWTLARPLTDRVLGGRAA